MIMIMTMMIKKWRIKKGRSIDIAHEINVHDNVDSRISSILYRCIL